MVGVVRRRGAPLRRQVQQARCPDPVYVLLRIGRRPGGRPDGKTHAAFGSCAYEVDVAPVFDTLDGADKESLGIVDADLDCPQWRLEALSGRTPASRALADRLASSGFAGMRVRSYAAGTGVGDVNLVLWRWGDPLPHKVVLIDDERRLQASLRRTR